MKYKLSQSFTLSFLFTVLAINLCAFFYLAGYLKTLQLNLQDLTFSLWVQSYQNPETTFLMKFVSFFGYPIVATLTVLMVCYYLFLQKKPKFAMLFSSVFFANIVGAIIKWFINRPRPTEDMLTVMSELDSRSFPSNHALHYTVFFGLLCYYLDRGIIKVSPLYSSIIKVISVLLVVLVGFSRVYLGAHWLSDVIGGYLLGSFFLILAILLAKQLKIKA